MRTKPVVLALCLVAIWVLGSAIPPGSAAPAAQAGTHHIYLPAVFRPSDPATRVVELVNQERTKVECQPLAINAALTAAAQAHTTDMALKDYFSHTGLDGSQPWDRMTRAGYTWTMAAENIAAGYATPESVVAGWVNSPGHYANMINCSYQDTGVGYYYLANDTGTINYNYYWTQDFGRH
jgi:uncharacterized protein YkwD